MSGHKVVMELRNAGVAYSRSRSWFRQSEFWALKDVSLTLYEGETLGVIGRNGTGKTTLLQLLSGIIAPDTGELISGGAKTSLLSLQVGFFPHLSGRENIFLSGMLQGLSRQRIEECLPAIIEFAELGEWIDEPIRTYSTGMRARLGFAVSFQADPDVLAIDEVLGVGDEEFKRKSTLAMKERVRSDRTVVLVSHSLPTIRDLCDRLVWIDAGETRAEGPVEAVLQEYLGSMKEPKPT